MFFEKTKIDKYLKSLGQGDNHALALIYEATNKQVFSLCYVMLKNKQDSEDAMQDTYLKVKKNIQSFSGKSGFAWIYTIAKNTCLNKLKLRGREFNLDFEDENVSSTLQLGESPFDDMENNDEIFSLAKQILSQKEFALVSLHAISDYKFREIAKIFEQNENTVRWQYNLAIKKLKLECKKRRLYEE